MCIKKYFLDNKDENELINVILEIYKKETNAQIWQKLRSQENIGATISLIYYILNEENFSNAPQYPDIMKQLLSIYHTNFNKEIIPVELVVSVFDKDWSKVKKQIDKMNAFKDDELNKFFRSLIKRYCTIKSGTDDEGFADDIPF